jgi:5'-nucleotidase (lipoprotein e(P4) family)
MPSRKLLVYVVIGLLTGGVMAAALTASYLADKKDPHTLPPTDRGLDSALFVRVSAEYRACCYQAYTLADERLTAKLAKPRTAGKPPAVVLDLDETVLDNGGFQARQVQTRQAKMDDKLWAAWEKDDGGKVALVPGAKEFLAVLKEKKVEAVYITNRSETHRQELHAVLKRFDIDVPDEQLLLFKDDKSDKTERRAKAAEMFDVLLWVGDNLRDFDNVFKHDKEKGADGRKAAVDERRTKFGTDWIILPNPVYGEWTKGFSGTGKDAELLK